LSSATVRGSRATCSPPGRSPNLAAATLVIETHDVFKAGAVDRLKGALVPTHRIEEIPSGDAGSLVPVDLGFLGERERWLASIEVRQAQRYLYRTPEAGR
jgi:hypothetical protein